MSCMKAGVVLAPGVIRYQDMEKPVVCRGTVLVKVKYTGICGSDVPRVNGSACHFFPSILGHEFSGTVAEVGGGVTSVAPGDRVVGIPLVPCMSCEACQSGNYSLCKSYSFIGSREFGSFAEYVRVPERNVLKIADSVSFEAGAFFEPATVALHGLRRLDSCAGKTVAILGGGTIGIFTMQWAKLHGAKQVTVFDVVEDRLALAKRSGADCGVNTSQENHMVLVNEITQGRGFDRIYEAVGNPVTTKLALDIAANRGQVCFIGTPTRDITFTVKEWEQLNRKELTLTGSWMSYSSPFPGSEWELTAHCYETGELRLDEELIFKRIPLSKIEEAFAMYTTPGTVKGKILIDSEL